MNRLVIFAALLLIQIVTAATNPHDAAHGVTILQPTSKGNANKGETVMAESSNGAPTECTSETCDKHHSSGSSEASGSSSSGSGSSSSASGGKAMKPVLVAHPHDEQCGCEEQLEQECACRKAKFVAPEIKLPEAACGCLHEEVCGCRGGVHAHREEGVCGCFTSRSALAVKQSPLSNVKTLLNPSFKNTFSTTMDEMNSSKDAMNVVRKKLAAVFMKKFVVARRRNPYGFNLKLRPNHVLVSMIYYVIVNALTSVEIINISIFKKPKGKHCNKPFLFVLFLCLFLFLFGFSICFFLFCRQSRCW